jgi:hypothetical protein
MEWPHWPRYHRHQIVKGVLLGAVALFTLRGILFQYLAAPRGIAQSRATALAAYQEETSYWEQRLWLDKFPMHSALGSIAGLPVSVDSASLMPFVQQPEARPASDQGATDRKIARNVSLELVVTQPRAAAEEIQRTTEQLGGFLTGSEINEANSASISVRVPVERAEKALMQIRKLALRVESERAESEDVTKQYFDTEARLRNLRASEQQYLQIMKRAGTVKDTLEVDEKLNEVRTQIEQMQGEFANVARRIQMVRISVALHAEADVRVLGMRWRPPYRAKLALRDAAEAFGEYVATMFVIVLELPVIALWLLTLVAFVALGWKLLRWAACVFFGWKPQPPA